MAASLSIHFLRQSQTFLQAPWMDESNGPQLLLTLVLLQVVELHRIPPLSVHPALLLSEQSLSA